MAIDTLARAVMRAELFHGLKPLQITEIARLAERIVFKPGETIVMAGAAGDAAYIIVAGIALRTESPLGRGAVEPVPVGAMIGEMAMLVETEYTSTIVAKETVRALRITRRALHAQMSEDFRLAEHLLAKIAGRLHVLAQDLRSVDGALAGDAEFRAPSLAALTGDAHGTSGDAAALRH